MTNNATKFYDSFGDKLIRDFYHGNPRIECAIRFACDQLQKASPEKALDLGFGLGWSSYEYTRALPECDVVGVDLSSELTKFAATIFGECEKLKYLCQDITEQTWMHDFQSSFDACVMLDVYEHIPKSSRKDFHHTLSSLLSANAMVILTCPSTLHQDYLREFSPEGLQPVDENVNIDDILLFARDIKASIAHFEYKSIWNTNDYIHVVLSRNLSRKPNRHLTPHKLISEPERYSRISRLQEMLPPGALPSSAQRWKRKITESVIRTKKKQAH